MVKFTTEFKGKTIETDILYRYSIGRSGKICIEKRGISSVYTLRGHTPTKQRICFSKGPSINDNAINRVIRGNVIYLPVRDDKYAISLLLKYFDLKINGYINKVNEYNDLKNLILNNNKLDEVDD